jgi:hypothetical protein
MLFSNTLSIMIAKTAFKHICMLFLKKKITALYTLWYHQHYFITCRLVGTIVNVNLVGLGNNVINVILVMLAIQTLVLMVGLAFY